MTSTNIDLVRSLYVAWEKGDYSSVEWAHPEIEFVLLDGPSPGRWVGVAAMSAAFADVMSTWEGYTTTPEEYLELDDGRVLVFVSLGGRGKRSGIEFGQGMARGANLIEIRDGKVTKLSLYWDRARALADAGVSGDELSAEVADAETSS